jgi:hypothetical protein
MTKAEAHTYEVRPRKDKRGANLISDALHSVGCGTLNRMRRVRRFGGRIAQEVSGLDRIIPL